MLLLLPFDLCQDSTHIQVINFLHFFHQMKHIITNLAVHFLILVEAGGPVSMAFMIYEMTMNNTRGAVRLFLTKEGAINSSCMFAPVPLTLTDNYRN